MDDKSSALVPLAILLVGKALRSATLFSSFSLLHASQFPVVLLSFLLLLGASLLLWAFLRPWQGPPLKRSATLVVHSSLLALNVVLWNYGLKHYGPLKTLLAVDFADVSLHYFFRLFSGGGGSGGAANSRGAGILIVFAGYVLLFLVDTPEPALVKPLADSLLSPASPVAQHTATLLGLVTVSEGVFGAMALVSASLVTMVRKRVARKLYADMGKPKRVLAVSMALAALLLVPFAAYAAYTSTEVLAALDVFSPTFGALMGALVLFTVFVDYYVDPVVLTRLRVTSVIAVLSTSVSFAVALVWQSRWELTEPTMLTYASFAVIAVGLYVLFRDSAPRDSVMPVYAPSGTASAALSTGDYVTRSLLPFLRHLVREIWRDKESRRIFFFLSINLMFMFVEMVYGMLTNSLGLIADAFHMMFDCTALAIGLWASVVAQWPASEQFTYGFGRVKVLSGFINGVFLLFIGSFVLLEACQRLVAPPEIKSDRLLVVSVLGLCVNLVGVWAFHDLHGGHEGHDHSHGGHDHAHGGHDEHAHAHGDDSKKAKKAKKAGHDGHKHEHDGHSHGGHDEHSHGGHDGHEHDDHDGHSHGGHSHGGHEHAAHEHSHHDAAHDERKRQKKLKKKLQKQQERSSDSHENAAGVYLHILADTLGSVGVIASALLIQFFGWTIADPICSGIIACFILLSTIPLLRDTSATLMERTPVKLNDRIRKALDKISRVENVIGFRDPHVWISSGSEAVVTLHVIVNDRAIHQEVLKRARKILSDVGSDVTVQVEPESFLDKH